MLPLTFLYFFEPGSFAVSFPEHLCSGHASFKGLLGGQKTACNRDLCLLLLSTVQYSLPPNCAPEQLTRDLSNPQFFYMKRCHMVHSWARGTNCCCVWTHLYANCGCTEELAACTTFPPLGSSCCCWFSLRRTWPLSPSARTALWYSIQNKMPYVNKKTLLTVTSCVGFLGAWESLLNWSQGALQPSVFRLTSAVSLCCWLMRVADLQASTSRRLSLPCQWVRCSTP